MIRISKTFDFDAAHWLPFVPEGHKCNRMHGHTYRVEIICEGLLDDRGMILDYSEIAAAWAPIHDKIDHRVLNDVACLSNPTTEILASWIFGFLEKQIPLHAVRVYESATTYCEVDRS